MVLRAKKGENFKNRGYPVGIPRARDGDRVGADFEVLQGARAERGENRQNHVNLSSHGEKKGKKEKTQ